MRQVQDAAAAAATLSDDQPGVLLKDLFEQVAGYFGRRETRQAAAQMVEGLLIELEDYNCSSIAEAGYPEEVMFATKPELAGELLARAHERGIRAAFMAGNEVYGGRQLRRAIRGPCRASGSRPDAARPGGRLRRTARHTTGARVTR